MYVSTNSDECAAILEPSVRNGRLNLRTQYAKTKYEYEDITIDSLKHIGEKIGFTPMSCIILGEGSQTQDVSNITDTLLREGLYIAYDDGVTSWSKKPNDDSFRSKLLQIALYSDKAYDNSEIILRYANNPNQINPEFGIPKLYRL